MSSSYSSLDWVLSHRAHFIVRRLSGVYVLVFCLFHTACVCPIIVTRWVGPGGIEAYSSGPYLLSVLWHYWLGLLTRTNPSPLWPKCVWWHVKPYATKHDSCKSAGNALIPFTHSTNVLYSKVYTTVYSHVKSTKLSHKLSIFVILLSKNLAIHKTISAYVKLLWPPHYPHSTSDSKGFSFIALA